MQDQGKAGRKVFKKADSELEIQTIIVHIVEFICSFLFATHLEKRRKKLILSIMYRE